MSKLTIARTDAAMPSGTALDGVRNVLPCLDIARLTEVLEYNKETGRFYWKVSTSNRAKIGNEAGHYHHATGYIYISIDGKNYRAHRLAWLYVNGIFPSCKIDHINGCKSDNSIANLRDVSHSVNMQNIRAARSDNYSQLLGAHHYKKTGQWTSQIQIGKKKLYLGLFDTPEAAHAAYLFKKRELHEGCTI